MKHTEGFVGAALSLVGFLIVVAIIGYLFTIGAEKRNGSSEDASVGSVEEINPFFPIEAVRETEKVTDAHNCRVTGGTYVGCPENPKENSGLCAPCECPEDSAWSFETKRCIFNSSE